MSHCGWGRQGWEIVDAGLGSRAQVMLRQHALAPAAELPRVLVRTDIDLPVSGCTSWQNGRWLIVLNGTEPLVRQRFSLANEFKQAVDHRFRHELNFDPPGLSATTQAEYAADAPCPTRARPRRAIGVLRYSAMTTPRGEIGGDRMRPVYPFETVGAPPTTKPSEPSPTGSSASSTAASPTNASTTKPLPGTPNTPSPPDTEEPWDI